MATTKKPTKKIAKPASAKKSTAGRKPASKLAKKPAAGKSVTVPIGKPVGVVTHFFGHISVGIVKFSKPVKVGAVVRFYGAHTDFEQPIASMQYDHRPIAAAKPKQEVGIKVKRKVHEGNKVYLAPAK